MSVKNSSATAVAAPFSIATFVYDDDEKRVKSIFKRILFVLSAMIAGLVMACNAFTQMQLFGSISAKQLQFPNADYYLITIVQGKLIAFQEGEQVNNEWLYANEGDQNLHQIVFAKDPNCGLGAVYDVSEALPYGRIQLWKLCRGGPTESEIRTRTYLMAYDWQIGDMKQIAGPLPLGSSQVSWNPDQTRGIVYLDSKFSSQTLYWIWEGGFGPLDLVITDRDRSWNLKNLFPDFPDAETIRSGNTGRAVWSPDGHTIAFFASPGAIGKTGLNRVYVEYNLYLMDADQQEPKAVLDNIYLPFIIKWSPDSKYVAFIGQYGSSKQAGLWLYSMESDSILNIADGKFQDILWNTDNRSLTAIHCDDKHYCSQIEEYDLSSILQ